MKFYLPSLAIHLYRPLYTIIECGYIIVPTTLCVLYVNGLDINPGIQIKHFYKKKNQYNVP